MRRVKSPTLYPFLLSKSQSKAVGAGLSFFAIVRVLAAIIVIGLWVKSVFDSWGHAFGSAPVVGLQTRTLSVEQVVQRMKTGSATAWIVGATQNVKITQQPIIINNIIQYPTQQPKIEDTFIPTYTPTPWWTKIIVPDAPGESTRPDGDADGVVTAHISYFWPPWGQERGGKWTINCDSPGGVLECETMASGFRVVDWIGRGVACPVDYPILSVFEIYGRFYHCVDRGSAIVTNSDGTIWLDVLYPAMPAPKPWGDTIDVKYWLP